MAILAVLGIVASTSFASSSRDSGHSRHLPLKPLLRRSYETAKEVAPGSKFFSESLRPTPSQPSSPEEAGRPSVVLELGNPSVVRPPDSPTSAASVEKKKFHPKISPPDVGEPWDDRGGPRDEPSRTQSSRNKQRLDFTALWRRARENLSKFWSRLSNVSRTRIQHLANRLNPS